MHGKRSQLVALRAIAAVSALALVVLCVWPATRWSPFARFLHDNRLPYPGKAREIWESRIQTELNYWKDQIRRQNSEAWRTVVASWAHEPRKSQRSIARLDRAVDPRRSRMTRKIGIANAR